MMTDTPQPPEEGKPQLVLDPNPGLQMRFLKTRVAPLQGFDLHWHPLHGGGRFTDYKDHSDCPVCKAEEPAAKAKTKMAVNWIEWAPKQHRKRRWMTEAYHKRVQKKWNARAVDDPRFRAFKEVQVGHLPREAIDKLTTSLNSFRKA